MVFKTKSFFPALLWFVFITILFLLPGSEFPDEDWFHQVYLDKWIHSFFFFLLVYLFELPLLSEESGKVSRWLLRVTVIAVVYGIAIEFIQKYWIPGRSFDVLDMVFDSIGCITAYAVGRMQRKRYLKK